jgi:hypothetical protein
MMGSRISPVGMKVACAPFDVSESRVFVVRIARFRLEMIGE